MRDALLRGNGHQYADYYVDLLLGVVIELTTVFLAKKP